ncbi:hypothetical protein HPB52_004067 [Rhipicephalus sanguineus]|uniref:Uncharacterized protein n=1 Tax=Rhipicephalus sanguineus TaxID=34632 RepID=A0A9D4SXI6_RHISA|nr:hypothetical protein HPB52_004067 [Rhipicephalus sanguineus]
MKTSARLYTYSLKHSYLPPEVSRLFGALMPSEGHVKRMCRILRSEACRQVRFYSDCLQVVNRNELPLPSAQKRFLEDLRLASQTADFLWGNLVARLPRSRHQYPEQGKDVMVLGDASIPKNVADLLKLGPKFCEHPALDKTELLGLVRTAAGKARTDEVDRCIREGVDCLPQKIFFLPNRFCWSWENDLQETLCGDKTSDAAPASSDSGATGSQPTTGNDAPPESPSPGSTTLGSTGKSLFSGK